MNMKKVLVGTSIALSALVSFAAGETTEAHAAEWQARSVEEIKADFQKLDDNEKVYVIKSGDTLNAIAQAADVNTKELAEINNIENANLIFPGTKLTFKSDQSGKVNEVEVEKQGQAAQVYTVDETAGQTYQAPATVQAAPAAAPAPAPAPAPAQSAYTGSSSSAKEIIAQRESGGSYSATNGQYIGRYQLSASYLNGDYSPTNQERVADQYVAGRYGSWDNALAFWNANGWY
ncbi:LysM peptidoglycan-binding domain-containing protein [Aerococcus urinae]|uniref:aggregation-promoting factor n=1 Tax=Aerococcus urinae TaxID=1376 RepID=UPI0025509DDD|nr:LysM domain-containing protein [Aerococcus urinae]